MNLRALIPIFLLYSVFTTSVIAQDADKVVLKAIKKAEKQNGKDNYHKGLKELKKAEGDANAASDRAAFLFYTKQAELNHNAGLVFAVEESYTAVKTNFDAFNEHDFSSGLTAAWVELNDRLGYQEICAESIEDWSAFVSSGDSLAAGKDSVWYYVTALWEYKNNVKKGDLAVAKMQGEQLSTRLLARMSKDNLQGVKGKDKKFREIQWAWLQYISALEQFETGSYEGVLAQLKAHKPALKKLAKDELDGGDIAYLEALCHFNSGDFGKAAAGFEQAVKLFKKNHQEHHPKTIQAYAYEIVAYAFNNKFRILDKETAQQADYTKYYKRHFKSSVNPLALLMADMQAHIWKEQFIEADRAANRIFSLLQHYRKVSRADLDGYRKIMSDYFVTRDDFTRAELLLDDRLRSAEQLYGTESGKYGMVALEKAKFLSNFRYETEQSLKAFNGKSWELYDANYSPIHPLYFDFINAKSNALSLIDKVDEQQEILAKSVEVTRDVHGENSLQYAVQLAQKAEVDITLGNYENVESDLNKAIEILEKEAGKGSVETLSATRLLAEFYELTGNAEKAISLYKKTFRKLDRLSKQSGTQSIRQPEKMARLYISTGKYKDAEKVLDEALETKTKLYGNKSLVLFDTYLMLAELKYLQGDFVAAQTTLQAGEKIAAGKVDQNSLKMLKVIQLRADISFAMGDYSRAAEAYQEVMVKREKVLGANNPQTASALLSLSISDYYQGGDLEKNSQRAEDALLVFEEATGTQSLMYANALFYHGLFLMEKGNLSEAYSTLQKVGDIYQSQGDKGGLNQAKVLRVQGDVLARQQKSAEANKNYEKAATIYSKTFSTTHPDYLKCQSKSARLSYALGDRKEAVKLAEEVTAAYADFVEYIFPYLNEREKAKYWQQLKGDYDFYYSLALEPDLVSKKRLNTVLEYRQLTKALLLNSNIKFQKEVRQKNDSTTTSYFNEWLEIRKTIANAYTMSAEELEEAGIDVGRLEARAGELEKEITFLLYDDGVQPANIYTSKDLGKMLKKDELLVETIRFKSLSNTDVAKYAFLLVKSGAKYPELVATYEEPERERGYLKYYRNATKLDAYDKYSYEVFWQELDGKISDGNKVYFSPDGVYSLINPEVLIDSTGKYIIDKNHLVFINNPIDVAREKHISEEVELTAELIGNPTFYDEKPEVVRIKPLPGAEEEVKQISGILNETYNEVETLIGDKAEKGKVKQSEHPTIAHFATHGYFDEEVEEVVVDGVKEESTGKHPLLMSGLLLKGAGNKENVNSNGYSYDGLLTAFEARSMDFANTELVVLSACETGLGQVGSGEGVYGLQRAFLDAGSKAVIMSLFKVNDEATKVLMTEFYKNWTSSGDKESALYQAKMTVKKQFSSPVLWGSFILVEG